MHGLTVSILASLRRIVRRTLHDHYQKDEDTDATIIETGIHASNYVQSWTCICLFYYLINQKFQYFRLKKVGWTENIGFSPQANAGSPA